MDTFDCSSCGAPLPDGTDLLCATCSYEAAEPKCPLCHSPAYVCHAEHTDGPGPRLHCRAASMHNFPIPESEG